MVCSAWTRKPYVQNSIPHVIDWGKKPKMRYLSISHIFEERIPVGLYKQHRWSCVLTINLRGNLKYNANYTNFSISQSFCSPQLSPKVRSCPFLLTELYKTCTTCYNTNKTTFITHLIQKLFIGCLSLFLTILCLAIKPWLSPCIFQT